MTLLDLNYVHQDPLKDIFPFTKNGIIIDTSVMKIFLDGFINIRFSKKDDEYFNYLESFLQHIKAYNQWDKFLITPHIFTQICNHLHRSYSDKLNYKDILCEIIPILKDIKEFCDLKKESIIQCTDFTNPIFEIGDISIFLFAEDFTKDNKKIAVLAKDKHIKDKFVPNPNILIMDLDKSILDLKQRRV